MLTMDYTGLPYYKLTNEPKGSVELKKESHNVKLTNFVEK